MPWHCEPVVYYDFVLTILLFFSTSRACFFLPVRASSGAWFYFNFDPFPLYVYVSTPRTGYTFALRPSVKGMKDNVEWTVFCCWKWVGEKFKNGFFWCSHFLGELVCMPLEYRWKSGILYGISWESLHNWYLYEDATNWYHANAPRLTNALWSSLWDNRLP